MIGVVTGTDAKVYSKMHSNSRASDDLYLTCSSINQFERGDRMYFSLA